jgi:hypothetical protein
MKRWDTSGKFSPYRPNIVKYIAFIGVVALGACAKPKDKAPRLAITDVLRDVSGTQHPILAKDKATLVLLLDAHCGACRLRIPEYHWLHKKAAELNAEARVNEPLVAAQFERLLRLDVPVLLDSDARYFQQFQISTVPTLIAFNTDGTVIRRWSPWEPGLSVSAR